MSIRGLESIALAVAHLEEQAVARNSTVYCERGAYSHPSTSADDSVKRASPAQSQPPQQPPQPPRSAASATLHRRVLIPGRSGMAPRIVSVDRSNVSREVPYSAPDAETEDTDAEDASLSKDIHTGCGSHSYGKAESASSANIATQNETYMSLINKIASRGDERSRSPSPSPPAADSSSVADDDAVPTSARVSSLSTKNSDPETMKEYEEWLMSLDLRELKTLTGPGSSEVVSHVDVHDVLCGRGGETNHHAGNIVYRQYVKAMQPAYIAAKRRDKPFIAKRVVLAVRKHGGRFLKKDGNNIWRDVGNTKAREKTSQALREGAPELREGCENGGAISVAAFADASPEENSAVKTKRKAADKQIPQDHDSRTTVEDTMDSHCIPAKKLRTCLEFANVAAVSPGAQFDPYRSDLPQRPMIAVAAVLLPPMMRFATISADDEEGMFSRHDNETMMAPRTKTRSVNGPRLKLLKKRLECEQQE